MKNEIPEKKRIKENYQNGVNWLKWGAYLSERQWGTVREDYSEYGNAWEYFSHEHSRSRAYRWGEDGIAGFSDDNQRLCMSLVLWNGCDQILKERLFGLTNGEGNHGEDVKEIYYYLDATPSHSYMKMLYKYPQREFPYQQLVEENRRRGKDKNEFELIDSGIFDDNRYFDVFVEYAKADVEDILMKITVYNRGDKSAPIHILPQLWFRNTWSWNFNQPRPELVIDNEDECIVIKNSHLPELECYFANDPKMLFCDNDTNVEKHYGLPNKGFFKDGFHEYIINKNLRAINHNNIGTKVAGHYQFEVSANDFVEVRVRLINKNKITKSTKAEVFSDFDEIINLRRSEADEFYQDLQANIKDVDSKMIQRQAFAGMLWSKQFYYYNIEQWLNGDPAMPRPPDIRKKRRNINWRHLNNYEIISMPDKWEYPWYAAWDLAFHCVSIALVDPDFAKNQLLTMTRVWYMHPNGQIPAYEWAFDDVNPPVHAWAVWEVFKIDRAAKIKEGQSNYSGDLSFLERELHKLIVNFTWWVNRKDHEGHNIFQGGFLGLDNIGVFDRSAQLPHGGYINQADGTSWMAMYALNLMRIALELAQHNLAYQDIATKFFEHFMYIAAAMNNIGQSDVSLWDDDDKFFYDILCFPSGIKMPLKVRSMVGLIPLYAVEILEPELINNLPSFKKRLEWFMKYRPQLASLVSHWDEPGRGNRRLLSLLRGHRMKRLIVRMLDEAEFLSDYGIRSLSKVHLDEPYVFSYGDSQLSVQYQPAESESGLFGGNSNWRGPVWFPVNYLIIQSLYKFAKYYGPEFKIEYPTGSGKLITINGAADKIAQRLCKLFSRDKDGKRAIFGEQEKFQNDPHFRDYILFYEYFHGDNGRGVGASHQTGWSGLVANLINSLQSKS